MLDKNLPDVAIESNFEKFPPLNWVGMRGIEVPLLVLTEGPSGPEKMRLPAQVEAKVSLDKKASRGIHMSRLYMIVQEKLTRELLSFELISEVVQEFLKSHQDLSSQAVVKISFEQPLMRHALKSANQAWRNYPVVMSAEIIENELSLYLEVLVTYSSTCPASAALSRQLIQDNFKKSFSTENLDFEKIHHWLGTSQGMIATPHAQRSFVRVKVQVAKELEIKTLINYLEEALQTAVQGAVKREDEQEFALRNGQNLMFCEDAARRIKNVLEPKLEVLDYIAELNHVESLHPHNAVSFVSKGLRLTNF